jgi:hypothetical protein
MTFSPDNMDKLRDEKFEDGSGSGELEAGMGVGEDSKAMRRVVFKAF